MDLRHEVGDGELQLVHPQFAGLCLRRQPMATAEIEQDVCGLGDHQLAGLQERRRKRRRALARLRHPHHFGHAVAMAGDVVIGSAGVFQRKADIFAAALNHGPVIELVAHRRPLKRIRI